jgi:uncharacterized protein (TIGR02145 family)
MKSIRRAAGIFLLLILVFSCKKEKPVTNPSVTTSKLSDVLYATATSGGIVTDDGGGFVNMRGVCWSTSENPTTDNSKTADGSGTGQYLSFISGLNSGTQYYLRAYAINISGTVYGLEYSFRTKIPEINFNPGLTYGSVNDIDGKSYKTIQVGGQVWMAENLRTTRFNDGTAIPLVNSNAAWSNLLSPAYCWFLDTDSLYENIYGAYYSWFAVGTGNLCPTGWHVPTDAEWQTLVDYLGGNKRAGSKIKETGTNNWTLSNKDATNTSGLTGIPAGMRDAIDGAFSGQGYFGGWWSATETSNNPLGAAWSRWIHGDTTEVARSEVFKKDGFNVRCIQN